MSKPTLLCLDDTPGILRVYQRMFKKDFNVIVAQSPELADPHANSADVILSDWDLRNCTAREFLCRNSDKPTVVVTGCPSKVNISHAHLIFDKGVSLAEIHRALLEAIGGEDV